MRIESAGDMLGLFSDHLLPVFLAAAVGYVLAAALRVDVRAVSRVVFFALAPCLVFRVIVEGEVSGAAFGRMALFTAVCLLTPAGLAALLARRAGWPRSLSAAVVLVVLLPNAGNFGLSANLFAFGEAGLAFASVFFVTSSIVTFTVGVLVASMGRETLGKALAGLPKVPTIWAVVAAFAVVSSGRRLPLPVDRAVNLLADACIPVFLLVLGMQLHGKGLRGPLGALATATVLRLGGGIAVAVALAALFGMEEPARRAAILQSAMPSAVITTVLATEYDLEPAFVTSVVLATTVLSPVTLTPLLAYLTG